MEIKLSNIIKMKKNWVIIKLILLIIVVFISLIEEPRIYENVPPFFIYPIVSFFTFLFSIAFFKGSSMHGNLSKGNFKNSPLKIKSDPLPFYHLVGIVAVLSGGCGIIKAMLFNEIADPVAYFYLFTGMPILLSVYIANKKFIKV